MKRLAIGVVVLAVAGAAWAQKLDTRLLERAEKDSVGGARARVELVRTQTRGDMPRAVFGTDDRVEVEDVADAGLARLAGSACLLVDTGEIVDNGDGTYTLLSSPWTEVAGVALCPGEPFATQPQLGYCSGFLAGPDLIVTSGTCLSPTDLGTTAVVFGYELDGGVAPTVIDADDVYFPTTIVDTQLVNGYDHTVAQLDRPVVGRNPAPIVRGSAPAVGSALAIVGHPSFLPTKSSDGATVQAIDAPDTFAQANLDAYAGDTGGMVVDLASARVMGVFARGAPDFDFTGGCAQSASYPDSGNPGMGLAFEEVSLSTRLEGFVPELDLLAYPAADTLHIGAVGGPFDPASVTYTIRNPTSSAVSYRVSLDDPSGVLLLNGGSGAVNGFLASDGTASVTVDLAPGVTGLPGGVLTADVVFEDLSNATQSVRTHTVEIGQTLVSVAPGDDFAASGPIGGPFPGSLVYTVTNERPTPVSVEVSASEAWVALDGGAGAVTLNLPANGSDTVEVSIGAGAASLGFGMHTAQVSFENLTSAAVLTRDVSLDVGPIVYSDGSASIPDNFAIARTISVPDTLCVGDLDVDVDIDHTFPEDLRVTLTSPGGVSVVLRDFGSTAPGGAVRYDDEGATPPDGPGALSDFDGALATGEWTLTVEDLSPGDVGTLNGWSLRIEPEAVCAPIARDLDVLVESNQYVRIALDAISPSGGALVYTIESIPSDGRLFDANGDAILSAPYVLPAGTSTMTFRPRLDFIGLDAFTYSCDDGNASNVATATLHIGRDLPIASFDMDSDPGWNAEGGWAFGVPQGLDGDPDSGFTGANVYGYNLAGAYPDNLDPPEHLTTTPIDLTGVGDVRLRFERWLGVEEATWDHASVEVSNDGMTWTPVWSNPAGAGQSIFELAWGAQSYDISATADDQAAVRVRWTMGTTDPVGSYHGWNIDDVVLTGTPALLPLADMTTPNAPQGDPDYGVPDGTVTAVDIQFFVNLWFVHDPRADLTTPNAPVGDPDFGMPDGTVTAIDLSLYVNEWVAAQ